MRSPLLRLTLFIMGVKGHQLDDIPFTCVSYTSYEIIFIHPYSRFGEFINPYDLPVVF